MIWSPIRSRAGWLRRWSSRTLVATAIFAAPMQSALASFSASVSFAGPSAAETAYLPTKGFLIAYSEREMAAGGLVSRLAATPPPEKVAAAAMLRSTIRSDILRQAPRRISRSVMGTLTVPVATLNQSALYARSMRDDLSAIFSETCAPRNAACQSSLARKASALIKSLQGTDDTGAVLAKVNTFVNGTLRHKDDIVAHGKADYWASISETMRSGSGDCEEFALLKLAMLRMLGFEPAQMRLMLVHVPRIGRDHAILVVSTEGGQNVLDNLARSVYLDTQQRDYVPLVSMVGNRNFIHGYRRHTATKRLATADLNDSPDL